MVGLVWLRPRDRNQPATAPAITNPHAKSMQIRDRSQPPTVPAITRTGRLVERMVRVLECWLVGLVWLLDGRVSLISTNFYPPSLS